MKTMKAIKELKIGEQTSFFSNDKQKNIKGTVVKINRKTLILEVKKQRTVIEKVKSLLGKMKDKKVIVTETKQIKKRFNQLAA